MTGRTGHAFADMYAVIEIDEVRQVVHAHPSQRFTRTPALAYGFQHLCRRVDLGMTGHAGFGGRNPCKSTFFNGGMTVTAVDTELADVMAVTEWHFLLADNTCQGDIRGSIYGQQQPDENSDDYQAAENGDFGKRVGAAVENLRHTENILTVL